MSGWPPTPAPCADCSSAAPSSPRTPAADSDCTFAAAKAQAEAAAVTVKGGTDVGHNAGEGRGLMDSPQGSGSGGHSDIGGGGSMWEWDAGLAIGDIEGGGSG